MRDRNPFLLIGLSAAVVILAVVWFVQNRGSQEVRQTTRNAVVQLKQGLEKGANLDELRTLTDAVQSQYLHAPGAFSDCKKYFASLQEHINTLQSYWWSETYRKNGFRDLTDDCDDLLTRLK